MLPTNEKALDERRESTWHVLREARTTAPGTGPSAPPNTSRRADRNRPRDPGFFRPKDVLAAQDEERRRIARDLHDGTAASLVALSLDLTRLVDWLDEGEVRDLARSCASLCEQSLRELRAVAFVLHPPVLERAGLAYALRSLAEGFSQRSGIQVTFDSTGRTSERIDPGIELTLYRVVQEALTNVLRHSGSRTARVGLVIGSKRLRLTVSDEGKRSRGRGRPREGVGLPGMRERVRMLGGVLRVNFRQSGTVLTAIVPRR